MRSGLLLILLFVTLRAFADPPAVEQWSNGFRLLIVPTTSSQVVSAELLIDYSALDEPPAYQGIRQVLLTSMLQGSRDADGTLIHRRLTAVGGAMEGRVQQDMLELSVSMPANALPIGLSALKEVVCHPRLSDAAILAAVAQTRQMAAVAPVGAYETASLLSSQLLYAGHPFATRGLGTPDSLARLTPEVVRGAYQAYILPNASVLAIVGRCDKDAARNQAQALFGLWQDRPRPVRPAVSRPTLARSQLELREAAVTSTCVMLTFPVRGVTDKDFLTLRVIDALLSGGTGARLFQTLREERHLAYQVATDFPSQAACSHFSLYAVTDGAGMEETKAALAAELARLQTTPVGEDELQRAKAYLKGHYLLSHQYSAQYAFDLAWHELVGLGAGYDAGLAAAIDAVTPEDMQRVARNYFTRYYLVVIIPRTTGDMAQ